MNERIKEVRKAKLMTLEKFGEQIGLKKSHLSQIEKGNANVTDRLIMSIVKEFGVDEHWLRTGEGEMFPPKSEYDQLAELVNKILRNKDDKERLFITEFLYNHMTDDEVHHIMDKMIEFVDGLKEKMEPHD